MPLYLILTNWRFVAVFHLYQNQQATVQHQQVGTAASNSVKVLHPAARLPQRAQVHGHAARVAQRAQPSSRRVAKAPHRSVVMSVGQGWCAMGCCAQCGRNSDQYCAAGRIIA